VSKAAQHLMRAPVYGCKQQINRELFNANATFMIAPLSALTGGGGFR